MARGIDAVSRLDYGPVTVEVTRPVFRPVARREGGRLASQLYHRATVQSAGIVARRASGRQSHAVLLKRAPTLAA